MRISTSADTYITNGSCCALCAASAETLNEVIDLEKQWKRTVRSWVYLETNMYVHGNHELIVENCTKILEYNDVLVRLRTRELSVEIWGTELRVYDFSDGNVTVRGTIESIRMQEAAR